MLRNIITETTVIHDDDRYIIFKEVSEDAWQEHHYLYQVLMYRPMYTDDNMLIRHPMAYESDEGRGRKFASRIQIGFTSFADADEAADDRVSQYIRIYGSYERMEMDNE